MRHSTRHGRREELSVNEPGKELDKSTPARTGGRAITDLPTTRRNSRGEGLLRSSSAAEVLGAEAQRRRWGGWLTDHPLSCHNLDQSGAKLSVSRGVLCSLADYSVHAYLALTTERTGGEWGR